LEVYLWLNLKQEGVHKNRTLGKNLLVVPMDVDTQATKDLNLKIRKMEENAARQAARLVWEENSEHGREGASSTR
jgi:hypothetical protein